MVTTTQGVLSVTACLQQPSCTYDLAQQDGSKSGKGTVAADPNVLPLGSKIRVSGAGAYSGEYTVVDSGGRVKGNVIDIYMSSVPEARKFGKKNVDVKILERSRPRP